MKEIVLRSLMEKDLSLIVQWRNQKEVRRSFFTSTLLSEKGQKNWFANYVNDHTRKIFIAEKDSNEEIGMIGLYDIDDRNRCAEIGSTIVGNQSDWGKGIGQKIITNALKYGFDKLQLHRIYAYALRSNLGSIRSKQKCGFILEGMLREHCFTGKEFEDVVLLGITRSDFDGGLHDD